MKIKQVRVVDIDIPAMTPRTKPRRPSWNESSPRQTPLSKYPEWRGEFPGGTPGTSTPRDGYVVPSDAPGFGLGIEEGWIRARG